MENEPLVSRQALNAFMVTIGVLLGSFLMLWIVTGDARIAATMVVTAGMTIMLILIGVAIANRSHHNAPPQQPHYMIDAQPETLQIPEPRWVPSAPNTLTRTNVLDDKARILAQCLRDAGLPPTRQNIKLYGTDLHLQGNEAASLVYQRWVRWEWAEPVTQGEPGRWKNETANDY